MMNGLTKSIYLTALTQYYWPNHYGDEIKLRVFLATYVRHSTEMFFSEMYKYSKFDTFKSEDDTE